MMSSNTRKIEEKKVHRVLKFSHVLSSLSCSCVSHFHCSSEHVLWHWGKHTAHTNWIDYSPVISENWNQWAIFPPFTQKLPRSLHFVTVRWLNLFDIWERYRRISQHSELVYASKVELFCARWKAILIYDFMSTRWRFAIAFVENEKVFCRAEKTKQLIGYPQCLLFIQLTWWMQNKSISRMKGLNYDDPHLNSLSDAFVSSLKFFPSQFLRIKSSHLHGIALFAPSTRDLRIYIFLCVTNSQFGWRMTRAWQTILFTREKPVRKKESRRIDDFSLLRLPLFSAALQGVWEKVIKLKFLTLQARAWLEW